MQCFHPLDGWRSPDGKITFRECRNSGGKLQVRCGRCVGCRTHLKQSWTTRIVNEASLHEFNCFVTLTYAPEHVPHLGGLVYAHFQAFNKRLNSYRFREWRKANPDLPRKQFQSHRFFCALEYGEEGKLPHFHAILFGVDFPDKVIFKQPGHGSPLYTSEILGKLWTVGFSSVGSVTSDSAAYCAGYAAKKLSGPAARDAYFRFDSETGECGEVLPECARMSLRPGIGAHWIDKYYRDVFLDGRRDAVYDGSFAQAVPKYYFDRVAAKHPALAQEVEVLRFEKASKVDPHESSEARLLVKEVCAKARLSLKRKVL